MSRVCRAFPATRRTFAKWIILPPQAATGSIRREVARRSIRRAVGCCLERALARAPGTWMRERRRSGPALATPMTGRIDALDGPNGAAPGSHARRMILGNGSAPFLERFNKETFDEISTNA